jgi:glycosyltransferase involved in cell wall biosynthesis
VRVAVNVEQLLHEAPGGIGRYTAELVRLLPARGVAVTPFTARHSRAEIDAALRAYDLSARDLSAPGLDPVVLPLPGALLYDAWHVLGAAGPVRRVAPVDLVHAPSPAVPPTGSVPLVVTVHDAAPIVMPDAFTRRGVWFHRRGFAMAAKRARLVIAVSEFSADEIATHTPIAREQIRVVPNGVDLEVATPTEVDEVRAHFGIDDRPYVFWAGTFQPRKNVRVLLDAFTRLDPETVPHRLVLAGPPGWKPDDADGEVARSLGDRVRLLGPVERARVFPLFAGADLFAFPSRHEGFGIPVLEAMAQGTAVVCSDIPALREVAGDAAQFVAPDDLDAWVDTLRSLLTDPAARARLVVRGRERVKGYSWARCTDATVAVYEEALG